MPSYITAWHGVILPWPKSSNTSYTCRSELYPWNLIFCYLSLSSWALMDKKITSWYRPFDLCKCLNVKDCMVTQSPIHYLQCILCTGIVRLRELDSYDLKTGPRVTRNMSSHCVSFGQRWGAVHNFRVRLCRPPIVIRKKLYLHSA